jgi:outer membrane protein assembly factor BamB/mono/diheme cytochrome c family protein
MSNSGSSASRRLGQMMLAALGVIALVVLVSACGGSSSSSSTETTTTPKEEATPPTEEEATAPIETTASENVEVGSVNTTPPVGTEVESPPEFDEKSPSMGEKQVTAGNGASPEGLGEWKYPNYDIGNTRDVTESTITPKNVSELHVVWQTSLGAKQGFPFYGAMSAPAEVQEGVVYAQDMKSDAEALNAETGKVIWTHEYNMPDEGVNGLNVQEGKVFGVDTDDLFALEPATGKTVWQTKVTRTTKEGLEVAPGVYNGRVVAATTPTTPRGHYIGGAQGVTWTLSGDTGEADWSFNTVPKNLWGDPKVNSGGGIWGTPAFDEEGGVYLDIANPAPYAGAPGYPWGSSRKGPDLYSDSIVKLNEKTGKLEWYYQVTPHDIFDHDLQLAPILSEVNGKKVVIASGKAGIVVEVNQENGELIWRTPVGEHNGHDNDNLKSEHGPGAMPKGSVTVLPGALGGTETEMAVGGGMIYAPIANIPTTYAPTGESEIEIEDESATSGEMVALDESTGKIAWKHRFKAIDFGSATYVNGVLFTTTYDGTLYAMNAKNGEVLWQSKLPTGTNAGITVAGNMIIAEAGVEGTSAAQHQAIVAYQLGGNGPSSVAGVPIPGMKTAAPEEEKPAAEAPKSKESGKAEAAPASAEGMEIFSTNCSSCHTLAAAGASGTVGPNLDELKPSLATVEHQVINGGGAMPAFGKTHILSPEEVKSVAGYVSEVAGKKLTPQQEKEAKAAGGGGTP